MISPIITLPLPPPPLAKLHIKNNNLPVTDVPSNDEREEEKHDVKDYLRTSLDHLFL